MTDEEIGALAKGVAPFVRECVTQATAISPELAQQVSNIVRLLNESPPIEQAELKTPPRITRIKRDEAGNFIPVYGDA